MGIARAVTKVAVLTHRSIKQLHPTGSGFVCSDEAKKTKIVETLCSLAHHFSLPCNHVLLSAMNAKSM